jgi:hypothetical protein
MRGQIKLFTLKMDVECARQLNAARAVARVGLSQNVVLSMDRSVHAPQGLISGR